jgi:hypothetical protein
VLPLPKKCRNCGLVKPAAAFPPSTHNRDGLSSWCCRCHNAAAKRSRAKRKEREQREEEAAMEVWRARNREALRQQAARAAELQTARRAAAGPPRPPSWAREAEAREAALSKPSLSAERRPKAPKEPDPEPRELVVVDAEPHYVDGEPV